MIILSFPEEIIIGRLDLTLANVYTSSECKFKVRVTCLLQRFKIWIEGPDATARIFVPTSDEVCTLKSKE